MASPQPSVWYHSVSFSRVWNFQLALFGLLPRYLFVSLRFSDLRPYFRIIVSFFSFRYWFLFLSFFISKYFYLLSSFLIFVFGVDMKKWKCQCSIQHYKSKTTSKRISQTKQQTRIHRSLSLYLAPNSLASTHTFYWKKTKVTKWVEVEQFPTDRFPTTDWIPTGYCYSVAHQTCVKCVRKQIALSSSRV